jgi:hypothetical protein
MATARPSAPELTTTRSLSDLSRVPFDPPSPVEEIWRRVLNAMQASPGRR